MLIRNIEFFIKTLDKNNTGHLISEISLVVILLNPKTASMAQWVRAWDVLTRGRGAIVDRVFYPPRQMAMAFSSEYIINRNFKI